VREFLEDDLGPEGRDIATVVVATSDEPAMLRLRAAFTATRIAEWHASQGRDVLFDIERSINGLPAEQRLAVRQQRSAPLVSALEAWMRHQRRKMSRHSDVAGAIDYMLKRWTAFTRFLEDGRVCLTNNAAERALRGLAR
jgi:hypothetical protein